MTQNLNERERLWADTAANWAALVQQVGVLRQVRGWVRWVTVATTVFQIGQVCRKTGALVGYELARKDEEADAAARAAMEREHKAHQASMWAKEAEALRQSARKSWSTASNYPGPV